MKIRIRIITFFFILIRITSLYAALPEESSGKHSEQSLASSYGKLPLSFEENRGQVDPRVAFLSRGKGYTLYLTSTEALLALKKEPEKGQPEIQKVKTMEAESVLKMQLVGANREAMITGEEILPGKSNYLIGNDPKQWRSNVPTYSKVKYEGIYPGIDLIYYGNQRQLEYDFIVAPHADPKKIELLFKGADRREVDAKGDLILFLQGEKIVLHKPVVYQETAGDRTIIPGRYMLKGKEKVGFQVAEYDITKPLVIDPVLTYSTFLGGSNEDQGLGIAVDGSGNAYITGSTLSANFPTSSGALRPPPPANLDAFITKLNPAGTAIVYSTYLGGSANDSGADIAIDPSGNAYVTGITNSGNFPTSRPIQRSLGGGNDAFLIKLNPTGSSLLYATYLGGSNEDEGKGVAVDSSGNAYVTGGTTSASFPGASPIRPFGGGSDAFVAKINAAGSAFSYFTYIGGSMNDRASSIAVDLSGQAYISGLTFSFDFPTANPLQAKMNESSFCGDEGGNNPPCVDAFVTKLGGRGDVVYSTYLGGGESEGPTDIAVDSTGHAYVTGYTDGNGFPSADDTIPLQGGPGDCSGGNENGPPPCNKAFVTKFNTAGNGLVYSTFLGGDRGESSGSVASIALDLSDNAYVAGATSLENFVTINPIQKTLGGGAQCIRPFQISPCFSDVFVTKINAAGNAVIYSTYLGGSQDDRGVALAVAPSGNAYVTGRTLSGNFPITGGAFQSSNRGAGDAFVSKISTSAWSDPFNRPDGTALGPQWNESLPDLELFKGQVRNTNSGNKAAIFNQSVGSDQSVSVDCKMTTAANACGVMARWSSESNFYRARLDAGHQNIFLFKTVNGVTTALGSVSRPMQFDTYYRIRLQVSGRSLAVFFNSEPTAAISVLDSALPSGNFVGIRSSSSGPQTTSFDNFDVLPLSDSFSRANSTDLGLAWHEYGKNLEISANQVRSVDTGNKMAIFNQGIGKDQSVSVDCKVTAVDNACGVMARWSDENNFYRLRLDAGQQNIILFKTSNGVTTRLALATRPIQLNTYYRLRLVVKGTTLTAFFANETSPAMTVTDFLRLEGNFAGIRSFASAPFTTWYDNFNVSVAP